MKNYLKSVVVISAAALLSIASGCDSDKADKDVEATCGDVRIDSALHVADSIENTDEPDPDKFAKALDGLAKAASESKSEPASSVAKWARGKKLLLDEDPEGARTEFNSALAEIDSASFPYLYARVGLDLTHTLEDADTVAARTLYSVLPVFIQARDSMRVVETLYSLNALHGNVWDTPTQRDYLAEAERYVPSSRPLLRDMMRLNVLGLERDCGDNPTHYLHILDSLRRDKGMLERVPPAGVMVYTDLYRLRGDTTALDTAAEYAAVTEADSPWHPSIWLFRTYSLRRALERSDMDSAAGLVETIRLQLEEGTPYDMAMLAELIPYYRRTGENALADSMEKELNYLSREMKAYEKAASISGMKASEKLRRLRNTTDGTQTGKGRGILVAAIALFAFVAMAVAIAVIILQRRRHRRKTEALREQNNITQRDLAAEQLRSTLRGNALSGILASLPENGEEADADTAKLRSRVKAALGDDSDWERFETIFKGVRPGFLERLEEKYPALTRGEKRLCCLLSLDMDAKQMARLLMIQPDSVKKTRHRLRHKLGMKPDETFTSFFASL